MGIGAGAALSLARQGSAVAVHGHDAAQSDALAARIREQGGRAIGLGGPIEEPATSFAAVEATLEAFGRLDTLVTSAGIQRYGDAVSTTPELWDEVLDVNTKGVFLVCHAALPHIRQTPAGSVVIVASVQGSASQVACRRRAVDRRHPRGRRDGRGRLGLDAPARPGGDRRRGR